jgi:raffinose/stachyose/melibiose transport system substrate-binding protein
VEFAKWLTTDPDIVARWVASGDAILPTLNGSESLITDPNMSAILEARGNATFAQGYLDQVTSPELGAAINEQVGGLVAGALTPEEVVQNITAVATA